MASLVAQFRANSLVRSSTSFLRWWRDELVGSLPDKWRDVLAPKPLQLLASIEDEHLVLRQGHSGVSQLASVPLADDADVSRQMVLAALAKLEETPHNWLLVEPTNVLRRTVVVPAAIEENLKSALGYEMDRHTPFSADQVHYDCQVIDRGAQTLTVELVVAKRSAIDPLVALATERGLALEGVDIVMDQDEQRGRLGVNLLPEAQRERHSKKQARWNLLLGGAFIGLLYVVMWQSIEARERSIASLQERVNAAREQVQATRDLKQSLQDSQRGASFLIDRKDGSPVMTRLLLNVTSALPDDTSLQRLQITSERIELNGLAPEPAKLIALLESMSCIRSPAPKTAYTPDRRSGKERFVISADIDCAEQTGDQP